MYTCLDISFPCRLQEWCIIRHLNNFCKCEAEKRSHVHEWIKKYIYSEQTGLLTRGISVLTGLPVLKFKYELQIDCSAMRIAAEECFGTCALRPVWVVCVSTFRIMSLSCALNRLVDQLIWHVHSTYRARLKCALSELSACRKKTFWTRGECLSINV